MYSKQNSSSNQFPKRSNTVGSNAISIKKFRYYIGIDPGTNTGFAVWDRQEKKLIEVSSYKIHEAMARVRLLNFKFPGEIFAVVEDARKRKFFHGEDMSAKAQGAGSVKRDSSIWDDYLSDLEVDYEMKAPGKTSNSIDSRTFNSLTHWNKQTSNHARDAALLVFQR